MDTTVLISALGWRGPEYGLLQKVFRGDLELVISPEVLMEFREVVRRGKLSLPMAYIGGFEEELVRVATLVVPKGRVEVVQGDPDDDRVLECAGEGKADFVVSGDEHLLKLGEYEGIRVVRAVRLLGLAEEG